MVIGVIGESCTGKSTIAEEIARRTNARVYTGKEYMKLAKSEADAKRQFIDLLSENEKGDSHIVYVITETDHLSFLPPKALRILVTAELGVIKERFSKRMNGNLPPPVAAMLEEKHGMFDDAEHDLHVENAGKSISEICDKIMEALAHDKLKDR